MKLSKIYKPAKKVTAFLLFDKEEDLASFQEAVKNKKMQKNKRIRINPAKLNERYGERFITVEDILIQSVQKPREAPQRPNQQ
jgi:hypothetical protein